MFSVPRGIIGSYSIHHTDSMNTHIKTTNISLTPAISEYVEKKLGKTSRILEGDTTAHCDVELARTTGHHHKGEIFRAEIHIVAAGINAFSRSEKEDLYAAIDDARAEIMRELNSFREKKLSRMRRGGLRIKEMVKGIWSRDKGRI